MSMYRMITAGLKVIAVADAGTLVRGYLGKWDEAAIEMIARRFQFAREDVVAAARAAGIKMGDRRSPAANASGSPKTRAERMAEASRITAEMGMTLATTREERIEATRQFINNVMGK